MAQQEISHSAGVLWSLEENRGPVLFLQVTVQVHFRRPRIDQQLVSSIVQIERNMQRLFSQRHPFAVLAALTQFPSDTAVVIALASLQRRGDDVGPGRLSADLDQSHRGATNLRGR